MSRATAAFVCVILTGLICARAGATVYVVVGGSGAGTSWADALGSVQDGIDAAFPTSDQVWVGKGTYVELITLKAGVAVYGGFVGTEANLADRPPFPRPTPVDPNASILDGNAGGSVVTAPSGLTATARLDGFTLTNGKNDFGGGGILCQSSSPTIVNNTITANHATRGAGIYCLTASPTISANVISLNRADDYGGGVCCETSASPTISGNTITGNRAGYYGGGIDAEFDCSPVISGNTISDNRAGNDGGGIYCYDASSPVTTDNIIDLNDAGRYGGGVCCYWNSSPILTNNTIVSNTASRNGAGIDLIIDCSSSISNNIVAFNSSGIAVYASAPVLRNNDVYNPAGLNYDGLASATSPPPRSALRQPRREQLP